MYKILLHLLNTIIPTRLLSRIGGHLARVHWPKWILRPFLRWYIAHYGVDMSEAEKRIEEYQCFLDFFVRRLRVDVRPIDPANNAIVSPVDGVASASGLIDGDVLFLAKGYHYKLQELLGDPVVASDFLNGSFVTIYLSPKDYHRIHCPYEAELQSLNYVPGKLLPVNPPSVSFFPKLFAQNERLTTYYSIASGGRFALVKIGATNVGRIRLAHHPYITNDWHWPRPFTHTFNPTIHISKAQEIGMFEFGSTVIMLFSPGFILDVIEPDTILRMGQYIGRCDIN
jgi:phosphatidylserine decarboxylase